MCELTYPEFIHSVWSEDFNEVELRCAIRYGKSFIEMYNEFAKTLGLHAEIDFEETLPRHWPNVMIEYNRLLYNKWKRRHATNSAKDIYDYDIMNTFFYKLKIMI